MKTAIKMLAGVCCAFAFSGSAVADVITVQGDSCDGSKTLTLTNEQIVTSTSIKTGDELPTEVRSSVIFHLDASATDGWEFTETNGGKFVTKIPSKNGNGRFLTREQPTKPAMWTIASGPEYVTDVAALNGKAMIDFGNQGSKRGLVFNADAEHEDTSGLFNIGSIVAVYGSERGGGWILGGGGTGYFAHRGDAPDTGGGVYIRQPPCEIRCRQCSHQWWTRMARRDSDHTNCGRLFRELADAFAGLHGGDGRGQRLGHQRCESAGLGG